MNKLNELTNLQPDFWQLSIITLLCTYLTACGTLGGGYSLPEEVKSGNPSTNGGSEGGTTNSGGSGSSGGGSSGGSNGTGSTTGGGCTDTWANYVSNVFSNNCTNFCHSQNGSIQQNTPYLVTQQDVQTYQQNNPTSSSSSIVAVITGTSTTFQQMPLGGPYLTASDQTRITHWIACGMP